MSIFLVYSTSGKKVCRGLKMAPILKILKYQTQLQFDLKYEKIVPNYANFFHDDVIDGVTGWPQSRPSIFFYKWNNNIFHDNWKKRAKKSSLNFPYIGIMRLWLYLYKCIFMMSLMTSPGHKVGEFLMIGPLCGESTRPAISDLRSSLWNRPAEQTAEIPLYKAATDATAMWSLQLRSISIMKPRCSYTSYGLNGVIISLNVWLHDIG